MAQPPARSIVARKPTKRVAGQSPAMDIAMNTGHEFVTKNLSTPRMKRPSVGTGAAKGARPKYLVLRLAGDSTSEEAPAQVLRGAQPVGSRLLHSAYAKLPQAPEIAGRPRKCGVNGKKLWPKGANEANALLTRVFQIRFTPAPRVIAPPSLRFWTCPTIRASPAGRGARSRPWRL